MRDPAGRYKRYLLELGQREAAQGLTNNDEAYETCTFD